MSNVPKIRPMLGKRLISETPQYNKKTGAHKSTLYIARCPNIGCSNEVRIYKVDQIKQNCVQCAQLKMDRTKFKPQKWKLVTKDITQVKSCYSLIRPDLFIREEQATNYKGETTAFRAVLHCPTINCKSIVFLKDNKLRQCKKCANLAKRSKPYERTYNRAIVDRTFTKGSGVKIYWKLTYDEFVGLCSIPNCHYCSTPLNRASYKSEEINGKSTAIFLDRKDSNKNYTVDNVVPCCTDCNLTKNEHISYVEMVMISKMRGVWKGL